MSNDHLILAQRTRYASLFANDFDKMLSMAESPIEKLFLGEMIASGWIDPDPDHYFTDTAEPAPLQYDNSKWGKMITPMTFCADARFWGQMPLESDGKKMILDFALMVDWKEHNTAPSWIAIECDGHEYHERTKEQAANDRSRDRALAGAGWAVARFTGSEIHNNAGRCIADLQKIANATKVRSRA